MLSRQETQERLTALSGDLFQRDDAVWACVRREREALETAQELCTRLEAAEGAVAGLRKALEGIHWMAGSNDASVLPSIENRADLALSSSSTPDTLASYRAVYEAAKAIMAVWDSDEIGSCNFGALRAALAACERGEK